MDKHIYFIRHGQTDYNKEGIIQGSGRDGELNAIGRIQAKQFYDYYHDKVQFDLIIHSALKRTKQTVNPFITTGISTLTESRINEISWGDHEGKKGNKKMQQVYLKLIGTWQDGNFDAHTPNGESAKELSDRLTSFIHNLKERPEKNILVCSHGRAMRCLMCILMNQHLREMESYNLSNSGLYLVKQENFTFSLLAQNDLSHRTPL